jgi:hypothetical protein
VVWLQHLDIMFAPVAHHLEDFRVGLAQVNIKPDLMTAFGYPTSATRSFARADAVRGVAAQVGGRAFSSFTLRRYRDQ